MFDWWMEVAGVPEEARVRIEGALKSAPARAREYFRIEINDGRGVSLRNDRAIVKGRKPSA